MVKKKKTACQCRRQERCGFFPWVGKIPWRREWLPIPVFLPGKSHGWRSLTGYSPWGCKESDMTKQLSMHTHRPMPPHSSTLVWKIPWTEEPGRLQSMGSQRVGHLLSDFTFTFHFHALEKEMATHSSTLAWKILWMEELHRLQSMGSQRAGHDRAISLSLFIDLKAIMLNGKKGRCTMLHSL